MYKNQLQELAQRSCFNLPSYACIREGPDHAPRFKATVTFNGELFESPTFYTTLRHAEHAAAEDETGVYKNLLQETAHRAGLNLPVYTTIRSGPSHTPIFSCTVELAGMNFTGDPSKTKKQAQKNAAMAAWSALKQLPNLHSSSGSSSSLSSSVEPGSNDEEQVIIARVLANLHSSDGKKHSSQNEQQQQIRRKSLSVQRYANTSTDLSFYSMPYQGWAYSNFSPELAIYHMWQREQGHQQQGSLLTLPSPLPNDPRMLQYLQSMIHANQGQFFPSMEHDLMGAFPCFGEASPASLYFPFYPSPSLSESPSQVTIQEIHEEKNQAQDEWFGGGTAGVGVVTGGQKVNLPSETMVFSQYKESWSHPMGGSESHKDRVNVPYDAGKPSDREVNFSLSDLKADACSSHPKVSSSFNAKDVQEIQHAEGSEREQCEWFHGVSIRSRHPNPSRPQMPQKPHVFDSTQSVRILHHPTRSFSGPSQVFRHPLTAAAAPVMNRACPAIRPHFAAPVTIRTAVPVCSARPKLVNCSSGASSVNTMAPAVLIRPVALASSGSPMRMQDPNQMGGHQPDGMLQVAEDFGKLHI